MTKRDSSEGGVGGQHVSRCVQLADYVFLNDKNLVYSPDRNQQLLRSFSPELVLMRDAHGRIDDGHFRRPPTPMETHMATAYAQSHNSQCLKRHVGATIVDQRNRAISVGYNENPTGIAPCINQFGNCFKDADMHAKLEARDGVHCPACGTQQMRLSDPWLCSNNGCLENLKSALFPDRNMYLCTAIHAEEQAIRSLGDRKGDGCTIYTTTFPCFQCARQIIDVGIKRVVFVEAYPVVEALSLLESAKIVVEPFQGFKARAFNLVF